MVLNQDLDRGDILGCHMRYWRCLHHLKHAWALIVLFSRYRSVTNGHSGRRGRRAEVSSRAQRTSEYNIYCSVSDT